MRAIASFALTALATVAIAAPALAAPAVVVPIDQSVRLSIPGSAYSVILGSPSVADVTVVDSHTLFISGRGFGATDVTVLDRAGTTLFNGEIVVTAPDIGRVSVYRGAARTDMACAPSCSVSARSGGAAAGGGTAPGSPNTLSGALASVAGGGASTP
jgi:Flp pilus assembly secretin CpaC